MVVDQHGFWRQCSCLTNLICLLDEARDKVVKGIRVEVRYTDCQNAFDSVNHRLLEQEVTFETDAKVNSLTAQSLYGRPFRTSGGLSVIYTTAEQLIPQWYNLGPMLSPMYVNYLIHGLQNLSYACRLSQIFWTDEE